MTYRYLYFNIRARGEVPRMLFAQAQEQYEDVRLTSDQWKQIKNDQPFTQIPVLEVEGAKIAQSRAISRFLARKFGLTGKTALDEARADMIVDCLQDTEKHMVLYVFDCDDPDKKEKLRQDFEAKILPEHLARYERLLQQNQGGDGWFVGNDVTWADFFVYCQLDFFQCLGKVKINYDKFPKLKAHKTRLEELPNIAAWIKQRPETKL